MGENNTINISLTREEITLIYEVFKDKIYELSEDYAYWNKEIYNILNTTNNKLEDVLEFEKLKEQAIKEVNKIYGEKIVSAVYIETVAKYEEGYILKFKTHRPSKSGRIVSEYNIVEITRNSDDYSFKVI